MAFDEAGTLGAIGSVSSQGDGLFRADFFAIPSFESVIPAMLDKFEEKFGKIYFEIAKNDKIKGRILQENGYQSIGDGCYIADEFMIQTIKYSK